MNSCFNIPVPALLALLLTAWIVSGCGKEKIRPSKDVSAHSEYSKGLKVGTKYQLTSNVFYRVYEGNASLHGENSLWCDLTIDAYRSGTATNQYVKGVVTQGTEVEFEKAIVNDLSTHTVILYYAIVRSGEFNGKQVLINSLVENRTAFLREVEETH